MYLSDMSRSIPVYPLCSHTKLKTHFCFCLNFFHEILGIYEGYHNCCEKNYCTEAIALNGGEISCSVLICLPPICNRPLLSVCLTGTPFIVKVNKNTEIPAPRFYAVHRFYYERADFHLTKHRILYCLLERVNIERLFCFCVIFSVSRSLCTNRAVPPCPRLSML